MEEDKRNIIIFFAISMLIMVGYPYFFNNNQLMTQNTKIVEGAIKSITSLNPKVFTPIRQEKIENIKIESENLSGTISSQGAKIDNVFLKKYKKDLNSKDNVSVFGDKKLRYFAQAGWSADDVTLILPDENTCWKVSATTLSENSPVVLTWDNGNGLLFEKHLSVDKNFLITIVDKVKNYGKSRVVLKPSTKINREFDKTSDNALSFYEGPLGYFNEKLEEITYEDIVKKGEIKHKTENGWFGITEKYWLVAFIPEQKSQYEISYVHSVDGNRNIYKIESAENSVSIAPSCEVSKSHRLFVGAKEINTLDMYENNLGVKHFDLAIDFGWLYIITKPLLYALAYAKDFVGNMGLGILLITLLLKLFLFPLANKSYRSMNRMKDIQPKIQALQKKYADDKVKLGQAVSEIYKKEGVNPIGGCLPTLLQSPVLFALYKVLYISIEMRQAPFIWWIHDLSLPDPLTILNLFGLIPIDLPSFLQIGIWPLLMGISMFLQQRMGPAPSDPNQANMMLIMPVMFTFMFAQLPSGLVLYWTFSNILGIAQQYIITKTDEKHRLKVNK